MIGLITDREYTNVLRRNELANKGFARMTPAEKAEWLGDPMTTEGANLLPPGPYYSSSVSVKCLNRSMVATATGDGVYLYAIGVIGEATKFEGKTFTLSVDKIETTGGGTPQIALYWHDDNGFEFAGASLTEAGTVTFTASANTNNRANLAAYVYVTTDATVPAGAKVEFFGAMLESGSVRHKYAPYTEVVPTNATKGAYNYSDLNRVERAVAEISDELGLGLITKTDWTVWDVPRVSDWQRYIDNVKAIRDAYGRNITLPEIGEKLTYGLANNIELILSNTNVWEKWSCNIEEAHYELEPNGQNRTWHFDTMRITLYDSYELSPEDGLYGIDGHEYSLPEDFPSVVGKYYVSDNVVGEIESMGEGSLSTYELVGTNIGRAWRIGTRYSQGVIFYEAFEVKYNELPEEGTVIQGSVSEGYYVLMIDGEYYYYDLV